MSEDPVVMGLLAAAWLTCGVVLLAAGAMAARSRRWRLVGRGATAVLFVAAGAVVNTAFLVTGTDYSGFAGGSYSAFVRDTWEAVVVPDHHVWIGLLVAFEATVGVLAVLGGRATRLAYGAAIAFHVGLLAFGFGFWAWALPLLLAYGLLLRAELRAGRRAEQPAAPVGDRSRGHSPGPGGVVEHRSHAEPSGGLDQPVPAPARRQPGRLVGVGRRGVRGGPPA